MIVIHIKLLGEFDSWVNFRWFQHEWKEV